MQPRDYVQHGIAVIPCTYRTKMPAISRWRQYQKTLPTLREVNFWARRATNWAVICGWQGLTVLDFDNTQAYVEWLAWAAAQGGEAQRAAGETYRVKTARGMHVYLFIDDVPRTGHFKWGDIKGQGGYVLIPPSVHPSGTQYEAVDDKAPILQLVSLDQVIPDPPQVSVPIPATVNVFPTSSLWPQTIVEEIKERIPITSLLGELHKTGSHWNVCQCPLHDDQSPSMWIDTSKGICRCFAGCNQGKVMDVISLYARLHGLDNKAAIKELAARL